MVNLPDSLTDILKKYPSMAIAFSGGIDSRFLCQAALLAGCDIMAIHVMGPHVPQADSAYALDWAARTGITVETLVFDPLTVPEIAENGKKRCYHCKKRMLEAIAKYIDGSPPKKILCDGGNFDDLQKYRPGMLAVKEAGVHSPLAEAGLSKSAIRRYADLLHMENPMQPSRPCLLTRFAYNNKIERKTLAKIEKAEKSIAYILNSLSEPPDFRLRLCPEPVLHITKSLPEYMNEIENVLKNHGFQQCEIRILENMSGFFDHQEKIQSSKADP